MALRNIAYLYWTTGRIDRAREIYDRMPGYDEEHLSDLIEVMGLYVEPSCTRRRESKLRLKVSLHTRNKANLARPTD
jgi:hypothetical protein